MNNNLVGLTLTRSTFTTLLMQTVVRSWLGKAGDPSTRDNFLHINGALVFTFSLTDDFPCINKVLHYITKLLEKQ